MKTVYQELIKEEQLKAEIFSYIEGLEATVQKLNYENERLKRVSKQQAEELTWLYKVVIYFETIRDRMNPDLLKEYDRIGESVWRKLKREGNHEK